jgi:hypothetical protein
MGAEREREREREREKERSIRYAARPGACNVCSLKAPAGSGDLAGTVTFQLFESSDCTGTAIYTKDVSVSGPSPQTVSTTNTTVSTKAANVSWLVSYDSTNSAQRDIPANCLEKTALAIDNDGEISSPPVS